MMMMDRAVSLLLSPCCEEIQFAEPDFKVDLDASFPK